MLSSLKRVKSEWAVEVLNTKGRLLSPWQIIASLFSRKCFKDLWKIFEILGKQEWEKVSSKLAIPTPSNCSFNIRIGFDTHLLEELKATWTSECVSVCVCVVWYQCHASSITQTGQCAYLSSQINLAFNPEPIRSLSHLNSTHQTQTSHPSCECACLCPIESRTQDGGGWSSRIHIIHII